MINCVFYLHIMNIIAHVLTQMLVCFFVCLFQSIMWNTSQKPTNRLKKPPRGSSSSGIKEIHVDEDFKIAVNCSLERFCYSDQKGVNLFIVLGKKRWWSQTWCSTYLPVLSFTKQRWSSRPPSPALRGLSFIGCASPSVTFQRAKGKLLHRVAHSMCVRGRSLELSTNQNWLHLHICRNWRESRDWLQSNPPIKLHGLFERPVCAFACLSICWGTMRAIKGACS